MLSQEAVMVGQSQALSDSFHDALKSANGPNSSNSGYSFDVSPVQKGYKSDPEGTMPFALENHVTVDML